MDQIYEIKEDALVLLDACLCTGNSEDQAIRFIRSLFPTLGRADVLNLIGQLDRGGNRKECDK
mgnify:CR=1 FL=1